MGTGQSLLLICFRGGRDGGQNGDNSQQHHHEVEQQSDGGSQSDRDVIGAAEEQAFGKDHLAAAEAGLQRLALGQVELGVDAQVARPAALDLAVARIVGVRSITTSSLIAAG